MVCCAVYWQIAANLLSPPLQKKQNSPVGARYVVEVEALADKHFERPLAHVDAAERVKVVAAVPAMGSKCQSGTSMFFPRRLCERVAALFTGAPAYGTAHTVLLLLPHVACWTTQDPATKAGRTRQRRRGR